MKLCLIKRANIGKPIKLDPYDELANAIVLAAVQDYRKALRYLTVNPFDRAALGRKKECEDFFWSKWFSILTSIDPGYLIEQLTNEAEKGRSR